LPLLPGKYLVRAHALDPEGVRLFDNVEIPLLVEGATREMGLVRIDHDWSGRTVDSGGESPDGAGPS
jgi:lipopolysaccharide transport system ATP-binding protein